MPSKPRNPKHDAAAPAAHHPHTPKHTDAEPASETDPAQAAFARVEARVRAMPVARAVGVDANTAAIAILAMSQRLTAAAPYAAIKALSAIPFAGRAVFDLRSLDDLADVAYALRYTRKLAARAFAARSKARLPVSIVTSIKALEKTMQKVCEGMLDEEGPDVLDELRSLAGGTGYDDDLADLEGYADLYDRFPAQVKLDQRRYQADQPTQARKLVAEALAALAAPLDEADRQALALYQQTWALAVADYGACQRVGLLLANGDPAASANYPPLGSVSHAAATRPAKPTPTPAPTTPPVDDAKPA